MVPKPIPAEAIRAAIEQGQAIVCYTQCWPCNFSEHRNPPKAHTWMGQDDAEYAGHPWPLPDEIAAKHVCACPCAKEPTPDA